MDRITRIQELLQATPKDNFLRHALALEYVKLGDDEKAKMLWCDVLNDSPNYVGSYYHLGKLYERLNQIELAAEWYQKGMEAANKAGDKHAYNELQSAYDEV